MTGTEPLITPYYETHMQGQARSRIATNNRLTQGLVGRADGFSDRTWNQLF